MTFTIFSGYFVYLSDISGRIFTHEVRFLIIEARFKLAVFLLGEAILTHKIGYDTFGAVKGGLSLKAAPPP